MLKYRIFLDGEIKQVSTSVLAKLTPGNLKGKGVFESMLVDRGKIAFVDAHLSRLFAGLNVLKIRRRHPDFSKAKIASHLYATCAANPLSHARLRLTVWQEQKHLHISVICLPYKPPSRQQYRKGFSALLFPAPYRRKIPFANIKSIDYRFFAKAYEKAKRQGYDEAMVLNPKGEIVEGSRSNVFFIKQRTLFTPGLRCGCLAGITRKFVLQLARQQQIPIKTTSVFYEHRYAAEEIFVTNSLAGIMPVTRLNKDRIGSGKVGPITKVLQFAYQKLLQREFAA